MKTATQAVREVQESLENITNDETAEIGTMSDGDNVRHGDVYVVCISSKISVTDLAQRTRYAPSDNSQLAPGNTKGSRHILEGDFRLFEPSTKEKQHLIDAINDLVPSTRNVLNPNMTALIGPVFYTESKIPLTHPEHGHRILPNEVYVTVYQRFFNKERQIARQQD